MAFKDKYTSETDKEKDKQILADDVYALCEAILEGLNNLRLGK